MIVTLAGHVDHGKTSLVRSLTGVDTDRLEQEKERGLTIDLGFAYIDHGKIGFVDVPGHQKFIHNMVAGVASHQYALLVIAADDGPMPQSREHLDILRLIGIRQGVIALTKTDRVDATRLETCRAEIRALTEGTFLADADIMPTSTLEPESIERLLAHLRDNAGRRQSEYPDTAFRLAVERRFVVKGAGLVVTGIVHAGQISTGDTLTHFPSNKNLRVRSIRAQDQSVATARAGDRCALNLTGLEAEEVERGHWIVEEPTAGYQEITGELSVLEDFPRAIKHWTPVHIYHATSHSTGRIACLDDQRIPSGSHRMIDLLCDNPLAVNHGDQLIIRDYSLDVTLGGVRVIDASDKPTQRRRNLERRDLLSQLDNSDPHAAFDALLEHAPIDPEHFRKVRHLTDEQMQRLMERSEALKVGHKLVSRAYWGQLAKQTYEQVKQHQTENPTSPGLRQNQFAHIPEDLRQFLLNALVQAKRLNNHGGLFQLPQHTAELPATLAKSWRRLEPALDVPQTPSTGDLAKRWSMSQQQIESDLKELTKRRLVTPVATHRYYLPKQLNQLAAVVKNMASDGPFSVKTFRDQTGIGRNVAIEILEYFDSRGFTRRQGNERVVLKDSF